MFFSHSHFHAKAIILTHHVDGNSRAGCWAFFRDALGTKKSDVPFLFACEQTECESRSRRSGNKESGALSTSAGGR